MYATLMHVNLLGAHVTTILHTQCLLNSVIAQYKCAALIHLSQLQRIGVLIHLQKWLSVPLL